MNNSEKLALLMTELGPSSDFINAVVEVEENAWGVACDDDTVGVGVEFDPETETLTVSTDLGQISAQNRLPTYETMLMYNAIGRDTGGIRLGITDQDGTAIQEMELAVESLELAYFRAKLQDFVLKASVWISILDRGGVSSSEEAEQTLSEFQSPSPDAIRV